MGKDMRSVLCPSHLALELLFGPLLNPLGKQVLQLLPAAWSPMSSPDHSYCVHWPMRCVSGQQTPVGSQSPPCQLVIQVPCDRVPRSSYTLNKRPDIPGFLGSAHVWP